MDVFPGFEKIVKSEEEWKKELGKDYEIIRQAATERAGSSELNKHYPKSGEYFYLLFCVD